MFNSSSSPLTSSRPASSATSWRGSAGCPEVDRGYIWGMLLAVPMLMVLKAICDHVEELQPVGELLGE